MSNIQMQLWPTAHIARRLGLVLFHQKIAIANSKQRTVETHANAITRWSVTLFADCNWPNPTLTNRTYSAKTRASLFSAGFCDSNSKQQTTVETHLNAITRVSETLSTIRANHANKDCKQAVFPRNTVEKNIFSSFTWHWWNGLVLHPGICCWTAQLFVCTIPRFWEWHSVAVRSHESNQKTW